MVVFCIVYLCCFLSVCLSVCLFVYLLVSLFVCVVIRLLLRLCHLFLMCLNLYMSLLVDILYYNFTLILYFFRDWYPVYNLVLYIYFALPLIHLLFHICINMYVFLHFVLLIIFSVYYLFALFCFCLV